MATLGQAERQPSPACQEGATALPLPSNPSCSLRNETQSPDAWLSHEIPTSGFSLAWESVGDSHIGKNFPTAFRNAACRIPLRNALPFARHEQAHAWATSSENPLQR